MFVIVADGSSTNTEWVFTGDYNSRNAPIFHFFTKNTFQKKVEIYFFWKVAEEQLEALSNLERTVFITNIRIEPISFLEKFNKED